MRKKRPRLIKDGCLHCMYYNKWYRILPVVHSVFAETAQKSSSISRLEAFPLAQLDLQTFSIGTHYQFSKPVDHSCPLYQGLMKPLFAAGSLGGVVTVREKLGPGNDDMCDEHCIISILCRQFLQCVGALCIYAGVCLG